MFDDSIGCRENLSDKEVSHHVISLEEDRTRILIIVFRFFVFEI